MPSRLRHQLLPTRRRGKASLKVRIRKVDFDETAQDDPEEPDDQAEGQDNDPEVYFVDARLLRARCCPTACLIGQQANARTTKKVQTLLLRAHLHQPLQNL